jgi:hypothetical protein
MTQSDAKCSLCVEFPDQQENTGNFRDFDPLEAGLHPKKLCLLCGFCRNSLLNGTGIFISEQGILWGISGNLQGRPRKKVIRDTQVQIQLSDEERRRSWNPEISTTASVLSRSTDVNCGIRSAEDAVCLVSVEAPSV